MWIPLTGKSKLFRNCLFRYNFFVILLQIFSICVVLTHGQVRKKTCPGLTFNGEISCSTPIGSLRPLASNCAGRQDVGTIAKYKCGPYFTHVDASRPNSVIGEKEQEGTSVCAHNGTWTRYEKFQNWRCVEECGRRSEGNSKPLITNGVATNLTSWPWHAALFLRRGSEVHYICGGTIIARSAVLTAAHCINGGVLADRKVSGRNSSTLTLDSFLVILGAVSSSFKENRAIRGRIQAFRIKNAFISESYDATKDFQGDIAILELSKKIVYKEQVSPACLPNELLSDSNAIRHGQIGDVIGFGLDENGTLSRGLKHGRVEINSYSECFLKLRRTLSESQFCAGGRRGAGWVTVCNGDSGGGLFTTSVIDHKFYIHGIVSTGDSSTKGVCQNYGVFTRVHSFISWIHQILAEIAVDGDGAQAPQPGPATGIEFVLKGSDVERKIFSPIPLDWKNKVTSIQLFAVDIDPGVFLSSLEYCRTVQHLNLTLVKFTKQFPKTIVRLPNLRTLRMDILNSELDQGFSRSAGFSKSSSFKNFISSLKFFEKDSTLDHASSADVTRIAHGQVNVALSVGIFKLMDINYQTGRVFLSQLDFADRIISNILQDLRASAFQFHPRHLALSSCPLDISILTEPFLGDLRTLILDNVDMKVSVDWDLLATAKRLEEFVLVVPKSTSLSQPKLQWKSLPNTLRHLSLTGMLLKVEPLKTSNLQEGPLSKLDVFYCDSCLPSVSSLKDLSSLLPGLKKLIVKLPTIRTDSEGVNHLKELLQDFQQLESAVFITTATPNISGVKFVKQNANDNWISVPPRLLSWTAEEIRLGFVHKRLDNFWSTEADYVGFARLSPAEHSAYETGVFKFKGSLNPNQRVTESHVTPDGDGFNFIPTRIQPILQVVEINDTVVSAQTMENAFKYCTNLKQLRLVNVQVPDTLKWKPLPFPQLEEFKIQTTFAASFHLLGYHGLARIVDIGFLFLFPIPEEKETPGFSAKTKLLQSRIKKIHMQYGPCVGVIWNSLDGSLISGSGNTNEWLRNGGKPGTQIKKLALRYHDLDPQFLPPTVTTLNLNFVVLKNPASLLPRMKSLRDFRFVNVRLDSKEGSVVEWKWPDLDLHQLSSLHSKSLEYLAIERAHLKNYQTGVRFENVKIAYIESCTFEKDFISNFTRVFPNLKKLILLGKGSDVVLMEILTTNNAGPLEWILSRGGKDQKADLGLIFDNFDIDWRNQKHFILKKTTLSGNWVPGAVRQTSINSGLLRMKGTTEFGADPNCHAYNLDGGDSPGFWGMWGNIPGKPTLSLSFLKHFFQKAVSSTFDL